MEASLELREKGEMSSVFLFLFFLNTFLLPQGITVTLVLTPVWLYLLHRSGRLDLLRYLFLPAAVFTLLHVWVGVDLLYYAVSMTMLLCIGICCLAVWPYLNGGVDYERVFRQVLRVNFLLAILSLPLLFVPPLKPLVWYVMSMSDGMPVIPRLKLFTYEASHYSYLLAPVAIYCYTRLLFDPSRGALLAVALISIPLALSLSFGVIGCLIITGLMMIAVKLPAIARSRMRRRRLAAAFGIVAAAGVLLFVVFPDNLLAVRLQKIFSGQDTSARGRTYESFILAGKILGKSHGLWGIGPGQLKVAGRQIIIQYYQYSRIPATIRIPNACAETLVCFGYVGLFLRLGLQLLFFAVTRAYRSPYRLWLFLFLFVFQFTGSFITNITEYIFWLLAFSPALDFFMQDRGVSRQ